MPHPGDNPTPEERAELRRLLAEAPEEHPDAAPADMTRDEALVRLAEQLGDDGFASLHLAEVAITNLGVATDIRAGRPARVHREWSVLITAPGYAHSHAADQFGPVVEQALADYFASRAARDAKEWARDAIPDKPPKLAASGTAERGKDKPSKDVG
jgi:hypothetical protein